MRGTKPHHSPHDFQGQFIISSLDVEDFLYVTDPPAPVQGRRLPGVTGLFPSPLQGQGIHRQSGLPGASLRGAGRPGPRAASRPHRAPGGTLGHPRPPGLRAGYAVAPPLRLPGIVLQQDPRLRGLCGQLEGHPQLIETATIIESIVIS